MRFFNFRIYVLLLLLALCSCKKYLEEKVDAKLVIPATLTDLQALLDDYQRVNNIYPGAGEMSADDYYINDADYNGLTQEGQRRIYIWEKDLLFDQFSNDWSNVYRIIYYGNTVLEGLEKIDRSAGSDWDNIKGQALVHRANALLKAAWIWAPTYEAGTAGTALGMPLRTGTDFNVVSVRASLEATYAQILADLKAAIPLLPVTPLHVLRPSLPAAYGFLAQTYLSMRQYDSCEKYAGLALGLRNSLMDYNTLSAAATYPFPLYNAEIIFGARISTTGPISNTRAKIDSVLYASYDANDLRRSLFFKSNGNGSYSFKGSYEQTGSPSAALCTDELYLIRAECMARRGNKDQAVQDINTLLQKRWKTGSYIPYTAATADAALTKILIERRKELVMRGLRWMDLKRLNAEGRNLTISRKINGQLITLPPGDKRYALAIPEDVIVRSAIVQNPR